LTKDVLRAALAGRHAVELGKLKREVHFIPENVSLDQALEQFLQRRQHLFMVVDEYGGVEGLIAMEDVMETMLGAEIVDEADHVIDLRALAKQRRDARVAQLRQDVA
jgi:CBS domain containing-hemolysin-like protein